MKLIKTTLFALLLLCLLPFAAAEVSSEAARSTAQLYSSGEAASIAGKYSFHDSAYWLIYFYPQNYNPDSENIGPLLRVAVNADTGELVSDRETLTQLFTLEFRASKLSSFSKSNSVSFDRFRNLADNYKTKIDSLDNSANQNSISVVSSSLERNFTELDFTEVMNTFESAREYYDTLDEGIATGLEAEQTYTENDVSPQTQNALLNAYNNTFNHLNNFLSKIDSYFDALTGVSQSAIAKYSSQASEIVNKLQLLTFSEGTGTSNRYNQLISYAGLKASYNRLLSTEASTVNDSVDSFLDRKELKDNQLQASQKYSGLQNAVNVITVTRKSQYEACNVDTTEISNEWNTIETIMTSANNAAEYAQAIEKLTTLEPKVTAAQAKYDKCTQPSETTAPEETKQDWLLPLVAIAAVIGVVIYLYTRQKKKGEEEAEEPAGKSLW